MPAIHTFLGGLKINEKCETNVPGLYAAGESAGHGAIFGADRVGGANGACYVLGQRARKFATEYALKARELVINEKQVEEEIKRIKEVSAKFEWNDIDKVRNKALKYIGVIRNGKDLVKGVKEFSSIREIRDLGSSSSNPRGLVRVLEIWNLALTGEMVSRAALMRTESRGQHQREDYPKKNNKEWLKWIVIRKANGKMKLWSEPIPFKRYNLKPPLM